MTRVPAQNPGSGLITAREVAELLGVSQVTVRRWADEGRIDHIRLPSGHYRIKRTAVDAILAGTSTAP